MSSRQSIECVTLMKNTSHRTQPFGRWHLQLFPASLYGPRLGPLESPYPDAENTIKLHCLVGEWGGALVRPGTETHPAATFAFQRGKKTGTPVPVSCSLSCLFLTVQTLVVLNTKTWHLCWVSAISQDFSNAARILLTSHLSALWSLGDVGPAFTCLIRIWDHLNKIIFASAKSFPPFCAGSLSFSTSGSRNRDSKGSRYSYPGIMRYSDLLNTLKDMWLPSLPLLLLTWNIFLQWRLWTEQLDHGPCQPLHPARTSKSHSKTSTQ